MYSLAQSSKSPSQTPSLWGLSSLGYKVVHLGNTITNENMSLESDLKMSRTQCQKLTGQKRQESKGTWTGTTLESGPEQTRNFAGATGFWASEGVLNAHIKPYQLKQ